jgi:hypothetical protein
MSSLVGRHTKFYANLLRTDTANLFPKNVFLREPNVGTSNTNLRYSVSQ